MPICYLCKNPVNEGVVDDYFFFSDDASWVHQSCAFGWTPPKKENDRTTYRVIQCPDCGERTLSFRDKTRRGSPGFECFVEGCFGYVQATKQSELQGKPTNRKGRAYRFLVEKTLEVGWKWQNLKKPGQELENKGWKGCNHLLRELNLNIKYHEDHSQPEGYTILIELTPEDVTRNSKSGRRKRKLFQVLNAHFNVNPPQTPESSPAHDSDQS